MTQFLNFQKLEVTGSTKEEALSNAPFGIMGDATQAFKNWRAKQSVVTEAGIKQFCVDYLAKKSKNVAGAGFSITLDPAVADTRERPYTIVDRKNEQGKRKYKTIYQLFDKETGALIGETDETKAAAKNLAKELIANGFHGKLVCKYTKQVVEGECVAFEAEYTPSKSCKQGRYLVFGIAQ
jgi:hypothetical protein